MEKWARLIPSPWSTKSQVGCRPNQAFSKVSRMISPWRLPSRNMSSSIAGTFASIIQQRENMDCRESEHRGRGHHVKRKPAAQHALQEKFRVHLVHAEGVFGGTLESAVLMRLEVQQSRFVLLLE